MRETASRPRGNSRFFYIARYSIRAGRLQSRFALAPFPRTSGSNMPAEGSSPEKRPKKKRPAKQPRLDPSKASPAAQLESPAHELERQAREDQDKRELQKKSQDNGK